MSEPTQPLRADDAMPTVDRFDPRTTNAQKAEASYFMPIHDGFEPTTVEEEKLLGGYLRTTAPEGAPYSELNDLYMSGSRGAEARLTKRSPGRTTRRGRFGYLHSSPDHQPSGDTGDDGEDGIDVTD